MKKLLNWAWIPLGVFFLILIHGSMVGMSDDEAYYWVLSRKLDWGYAYHPPMVAWCIAFFRFFLERFETPEHYLSLRVLSVRLPVALSGAALMWLILDWLKSVGLHEKRLGYATLLIMSFLGFFAGAWMMVPDVPLFLGWMILWRATWMICFESHLQKERLLCANVMLVVGSVLLVLSKFSGVLALFSAMGSILFWAPKERKTFAVKMLLLGLVLAALPIVVWNAQNHWVSLLYQLHDRHQGEINLKRFFGFWAAQIGLAGPALFWFGLTFWRRAKNEAEGTLSKFVALWALPPAIVFGIQPLFSSFKPHWILVAWFPFCLELVFKIIKSNGQDRALLRLSRLHLGFGFPLVALVWLSCHFPIQGMLTKLWIGHDPDPKWDVTNDLYGWSELRDFVFSKLGPEGLKIPVVGSRYQTAAQAAFAWPDPDNVTQIPRNEREWKEWPDLPVAEERSSDWPSLKNSVIFVTSHRYPQEPEFKNSKCETLGEIQVYRGRLPSQRLKLYVCNPMKS